MEVDEPQTNGFSSHAGEGDIEKPMMNGIDSDGSKKESSERKEEKKHSSSSSDKHRSSSSHGDKHRSSSSHKHGSSSSHKHSSSSSSRDKDRHSSSSKHHSSSSSSRDKHHSSSSSSKHHSSSSSSKDKDRHSSSSKDRHSSFSKHHSSSSSSRDKDRHSSSKDKDRHRSSSSKDKDRHRDKDRHHHSSSKDKDRHSSSSKHSSSSSSKDKDRHKSSSSSDRPKEEPQEVSEPIIEPKPEPVSPVKTKEEPMSPIKEEVPEETFDSADDSKAFESPKKEREPIEEDMDTSFSPKPKIKKEPKKRKSDAFDDDDDYQAAPAKKKKKKGDNKKNKSAAGDAASPVKKGKVKKEETEEKWKWWEEERTNTDVKWKFLEHKGPVFAPPYERLPSHVRFYYDGKEMKLSEAAEEVGGFYAKMLNHDYTTRDVFNQNFMKDWRKEMTKEEKAIITDISKCNFKPMHQYFTEQSEIRKAMSKEEKKKIKEQNEALIAEYGFCVMDGHKEKIGNFRIEPPGLFRGRGEHPKQGMLKRRIMPGDIIINCSKDSNIPKAPDGHKWKEIQHDNTVTWLTRWTENIQGSTKYIMLGATSRLKGEKDWMKYENARKLHFTIDKIRANYREDMKSKEMRIRQRAVALYFIDKLALRAGNEKEEGETADTVGCCSLRVEHINLHPELDGKEYVVEFDFLGKDSIRYQNSVAVDKKVFKNLQLFVENKADGDDLFDRLNTSIMNKHLQSIKENLTAKVFRTYNASRTLQEQLDLLTEAEDGVAAKLLAYNRANRAVAVLCNHQRAVSKNFSKQMENMQKKIDAKRDAIADAKKEVKAAKADLKALKTQKQKTIHERKKKQLERLQEQLVKLEVAATDKDENKDIALGTSKLNYLDPRISVAWCKKWDVPIEKVYNKTQREKFAWAIDMTEDDFNFLEQD